MVLHPGRHNPVQQYRLGLTCWKAALQRGTWECWWTQADHSMPWLPRPMASWGALRRVWPAGPGRFSSPSTLP